MGGTSSTTTTTTVATTTTTTAQTTTMQPTTALPTAMQPTTALPTAMQTTTAPAATTKAILAPGLRSDEHTVIALSCLVSFMFVISVVALAYALRNRKRRSRSSEDEIAKDRVETISNKGAPENIPENTYVNVVECLSNDPNGTVTYSEVTILSGSSWRPTPENTEYDTVNVSRGASVKSTAEPET